MRYPYCLLTVLFIFCYGISFSQARTDTLITGNFKDLKVEQFIRELENQTSYHFYYDPNQVDSLSINVSVQRQPLQKVLELAFSNTDIHFSIDQHNNVFLLKS